jgi:hypothetical protein
MASPLPLARPFGFAIIAPAASGRSLLFSCTTRGRILRVWVKQRRQMMSAATAAFPGSGRRLTPGALPLMPCWSFSESRRMTMQDTETQAPAKSRRPLGTKASSSAPSRRYGQSTCGRSAPSSKSQTANATWRSSISKSVKGTAIEPLRPAWPSRHLVQSFGSSAVLRSGITVLDPSPRAQ